MIILGSWDNSALNTGGGSRSWHKQLDSDEFNQCTRCTVSAYSRLDGKPDDCLGRKTLSQITSTPAGDTIHHQ